MGFPFLRSLSYAVVPEAAGRRDLRLDLLRGFCVFVMVVDHIGGEPSWLYAITGGGRFLVSAAEGFILLSGVTMGIVYGDVLARRGFRDLLGKILRRARLLYTLTVSLTLVFAALSLFLGSPWTHDVTPDRPHRFVLGVVTLHRSYTLTDVLLLYTLLVIAAAPLLWWLARGGAVAALAASWALWAIWQAWPVLQFPWPITDGGFPFPAWQALFVTGMVAGYHRATIGRALQGRGWLLWVPIVASMALVALYVSGVLPAVLGIGGQLGTESDPFFGKHHLRVGRVVALAAIAPLSYALVTVVWLPIRRAAGWLLLPIGQRALAAYSIHLFVVALAASQAADPLRGLGQHAWIQLLGASLVWASLPLLSRLVEMRSALLTRFTTAPAVLATR